jgi:FkbH-like protein
MTSEKFTSQDALIQLLSELEPKPASYLNACRQIESLSTDKLRTIRLSVLSSFTAEVLRPYIVTEGARQGLRIIPHFCPFNQIEIQALNSRSDLYCSRPDVIVIACRLEELASQLIWRYAALSTREVEAEIASLRKRFECLLEQIRKYSDAVAFVFNCAFPTFADAGLADASLEIPQTSAIALVNQAISEVCRTQTSVFVFDYARLFMRYGSDCCLDQRLQYTARIPLSTKAHLEIGARLARQVRALFRPPCKCLVVDLDNTLWGGIVGEDGLGGIKLGEDYPGNIYRDFQRRLISLRDQGILLAIASKNNEKDALEVFEHHPDMLLGKEDFAAIQIHWGNKVDSLKAIAAELNIGLDALAFFDDNPIERDFVRRTLPDVNVIEVPSNPIRYLDALEESAAFDRLIISTDDRHRANRIQESRKREESRVQAETLEGFLESLQMTATIGRLGSKTLPRVVQLIAKTNQFNLTTRRYSAAQLQTIAESGGIILWMRVKDKFGDNGVVGVAIGVPEEAGLWRIDSFLLSCRVIGRRVDTALLWALARLVFERGCRVLLGEYIPTAKNTQVANFYESHGFQSQQHNRWTLDLTSTEIGLPTCVNIEYENER